MRSLPAFLRSPSWLTHLERLARWIGWALLVVGLMLAFAWSALHFWIVPRIGEFRPELEQLAQKTLGVPVHIGAIEAKSTGWAPSVELRDITLRDSEGRPALQLPRVVLAISVRSMLGLNLEQLVLDRPSLEVRHTRSGQWLVAGLALGTPGSENSAAADWLFSQREVIVRDGNLRWISERALTPTHEHTEAQPPVLDLTQVDLVLRNSARHHALRIDATPPAPWGERFVLMGRFQRSLLSTHPGHLQDWSGQAYTFFPQVDVSQLRQHVKLGIDVASGQGRLRLWSDIERGQWTGGAADMDLQHVQATLAKDLAPLGFASLSGRLAGKLQADGWSLSTRDLAFVSQQGLTWPGGNVAIRFSPASGTRAEKGEVSGDRLDLESLREVGLRLPLPGAWRDRLEQYRMTGQVSSLRLNWQGPRDAPLNYDARIEAQDLRLQATDEKETSQPGVEGAHITLEMTQQAGRVQLHIDHGGHISWPGWLEDAKVPVRELHIDGRWQRQGGLLQVPQWKIQMVNDDLRGEVHGEWHASADGGPGVLDLQGRIDEIDAGQFYRYLPATLSQDVRHYVRDSVVKGTVSKLNMRIKGDLRDLPFPQRKQGEFHFSGQLRDVDMVYVPARLLAKDSLPWPRISGLKGELVFDRQSMKLSGATARLADPKSGPQLNNLKADIADLTRDVLVEVSTEIRTGASQAVNLIQQSPLQKMLLGALDKAQVNGNLQGKLKLAIPVLHAQDAKVQGSVLFAGNDLNLVPGMPSLEKVQGTLNYTDAGFQLQGVQVRLLGGMARLEGGSRAVLADAQEPSLLFRAQGQATAEGLRQASGLQPLNLLAQHAQGTTSYNASLGWRQGQPELSVRSTLEGLELNLPAPLGKRSTQAMPLSISSRVQGQERNLRDLIQIELGNIAAATYVRDLSGATPQVLRGNIGIASARPTLPPLPEKGVAANMVFDQFSVDAWQALWPAGNLLGESIGGSWQSYLPHRMSVQAQTLTTEGRTLHQLVAGVTREGNTWKANVDARELSGQLQYTLPASNQAGRLYARLSRLNLPPSSVSDVESMLEAPPVSMPALDIQVNDLELRGKKLGRVDIEAVNQDSRTGTGNEWLLNKFNITVPEASFRATGRWLTAADGTRQRKTDMNFRLEVSDAGALLTRLGTPGALRGGSGRLEGQVGWVGSPLALHYPTMNGRFGVQMGRGQFLKADAGGAKLLGVLSLQALPRRLLLDFRDVFSEGFAFDSVQGDVTIAQGIATTRNMQIKGVNALVQMDGSADIARETQQLKVLILPELDAGTASLVAGIAVNPVVGLTSFLAQLLLQKPLAKASLQVFTIDGSWSDPRVTRLDPAASLQTPPASAVP